MKRTKRIICCLVLVCAAAAAVTAGVRIAGDKADTGNAAFSINGEAVPREDFDTYLTLMKQADPELEDSEIKDRYIRLCVTVQEAERRGLSASEDEIDELNAGRFALLEEDGEAYRIIKDYADSRGLTMDEYIEMSRTVSEQALITDKLKEAVEEEFLSSREAEDAEMTAEEYYDRYIDGLVSQADIEE